MNFTTRPTKRPSKLRKFKWLLLHWCIKIRLVLEGCSSAEPFSAYLGSVKEIAYQLKITKRLFNKYWGLGR
jgi:hypothetical protein